MSELEWTALTAGIVGGIVGGVLVAILVPVFDRWLEGVLLPRSTRGPASRGDVERKRLGERLHREESVVGSDGPRQLTRNTEGLAVPPEANEEARITKIERWIERHEEYELEQRELE